MIRRSALEVIRKREVNSLAIARKRSAKSLELPSQSATFLDLPTEIRVTIYKLCFTGALLFVNGNGIDVKSSRARGEVARASKEIYSEAMPVLYSLTTLVYHGLTKGPASVNLIPQYQKYVPQIVIRTSIAVTLSLQNLAGYKSLKNLRIDVGQLDEWIFRGQNMSEIEKLPAPGDAMLVSMIMRTIEIRCSNSIQYAYHRDCRGPVKFDDFNKLAMSKKRSFNLEICAYIEWGNISTLFGTPRNAFVPVGMAIIIDWDSKTIVSKTLDIDVTRESMIA